MCSSRSKTSEIRALILVGGYGTRLRPLTLTRPKPLVEFANKAIVLHQIEALADAGIRQVILAVSSVAVDIERKLVEEASKIGVTLLFSHESKPLGTAGPLALARNLLNKSSEHFFVLNSDVICDFPFKDLLSFHRNHGKEGTIVVTKVDEPSKYGVVICKENGQVDEFFEKPQEFVSNKINAGIYILNPSMLNRIELRAMSIEKEVFPQMAEERQLYAMNLLGFWMDIGQPKDFIKGTSLYLANLRHKVSDKQQQGDNDEYTVEGNVLIDPTATIGKGCRIGPDTTIGPNVTIEDGSCVRRSVILHGAQVFNNVWMESCIVGWGSHIGRWVRMENFTVIGENVTVKEEVYLNGAQIMPYKNITQSVHEPQVLM